MHILKIVQITSLLVFAVTSANEVNYVDSPKRPASAEFIKIGESSIKVLSNPFVLGISRVRILVTPNDAIPGTLSPKTTLNILDAAGTKIVSISAENVSTDNTVSQIEYEWGGTNSNGRLVGAGTYVAVVTIDNGKKVQSKKVLITAKNPE